MNDRTPALGKLYLVPAPLDFGCATQSPITDVLPELTLRTAARLQHWVCENAKSTRAYLKRLGEHVPLSLPLQQQNLQSCRVKPIKKATTAAKAAPCLMPRRC